MAQKLKFGNGTWATKEGSTLAYNDENNNYKPLPFSFERDSIATRVNKEGLIEVVGNDIPRIDYTDSTEGALLLEPSRSNLVTYSEAFDNAYWIRNGSSVTSGFLSPDGTLNASKLSEDNTNAIHRIYQTATVSASPNATISIYVKYNQRKFVLIRVADSSVGRWYDIENGVLGSTYTGTSNDSSIESVGNGWYRISISHTVSNQARLELWVSDTESISAYQGDTNKGVYIYGAQLEQGSYPTSYIPTNGSTVQRAAETANGSGNSEVFNDSEGVLFCDIAALTEIDTFRAISISSGSDNNRINIWYWNNGTFKIDSNSGANVQSNFDFDANMTLFNKIAFKYKQNDFCVFHNGFKIGIDTSGITPVGLSELSFDRANGAYPFYGKTKEIAYYDTVLTDAELEYMTSYRSLSELVTELNLNTL